MQPTLIISYVQNIMKWWWENLPTEPIPISGDKVNWSEHDHQSKKKNTPMNQINTITVQQRGCSFWTIIIIINYNLRAMASDEWIRERFLANWEVDPAALIRELPPPSNLLAMTLLIDKYRSHITFFELWVSLSRTSRVVHCVNYENKLDREPTWVELVFRFLDSPKGSLVTHCRFVAFETLITFLTIENNNLNIHTRTGTAFAILAETDGDENGCIF